MTRLGFSLITALLALVATPLSAAAPHIRPQLVAESDAPAAGAATTLALVMRPDPGWHGYWKNPGDAGVETSIEWSAPAGVTVGPLAYPVPQTLIVSGLMNYVYEGEYAQLIALKLPPGLAPGTRLPIRGKANWLACTDEICVPESAEIAVDLIVGGGVVAANRRADFDRWRAAMPRPLGSKASYTVRGGRFRLGVPLPESMPVAAAYFFPLTDGVIDYAAPQTASRNGDTIVIETVAREGAAAGKIEGVLKIGEGQGLALVAERGEVIAAGTPIDAKAGREGKGAATFLIAFGSAIVGGLLLNIMPCVFPILSLKALSLARAGSAKAHHEALAYGAGVVTICLALGAVLLTLRAGGAAAGWAFQLQDSRVILLLLLLTAAIGLNLAGLFELPAISGGEKLAATGGTGGAFWTGALAAFVATPCTGPFMGAALGVALVLPPAAAMAVFGGLGLGLALPFLLIGFVPGLRRRLPKPGPWMDWLRRILALPMFATALGLAWILGRQTGVDGMMLGLTAALVIGVALWWVGRRQARGLGRAWWPLAPALALAVGLALVVPGAAAVTSAAANRPLGAEPFSETRLAALRAAKRPVFVYFTADWCLTCKVNEQTAIDRAEVREAFRRANIAVLIGDWTKGDAAIGRFLAGHGRSGVPLYLFYRPGRDAEILPQILTPGRLIGLTG